ncbi:MAG: ribonuclease J [bacterium]
MSNAVNLIFLGGACEVGKNCLVIETGEDIVVVDAGLSFPGYQFTGGEFVIPDFQHIKDNKSKVRGIVLTHGHEDHIGALPYLLKAVRAPVYGGGLTLGLVEARQEEFRRFKELKLTKIQGGEKLRLGKLEVEFIRVNHSIPDNFGFALRTSEGLVVHTGDYKMDKTPVDGKPTDINRLKELGDEGVSLLICDCTNVQHRATTPSEAVVKKRFEEIFKGASGKIIFSTFASNVHRIQTAFEMAEKFHRKVFIVGRSMVSVIEVARRLGYLKFSDEILRDVQEIKKHKDSDVLVMCTGTQGEPLSALRLVSMGQHKHVSIAGNDTVILSASAIPGNEPFVNDVINNICRIGAKVIFGDESGVHVSGHGGGEEMASVVRAVRPKCVVPFHGEYRHIRELERVLIESEAGRSKYLIVENGAILTLRNGEVEAGEKIAAGDVYVGKGEAGDAVKGLLRERRQVGGEGMVAVSIGIDKATRELRTEPDVEIHGFPYPPLVSEVFENLRKELKKYLKYEGSLPDDTREAKAMIKDFCKGKIQKNLKREPLIVVLINEY